MPLTGTTNTAANTALRYLAQNQSAASSSLAKLSSGSRIVKASDDAASLAVGTKVMADVNSLRQAAVNASQASSLLQVADGGMAKISDILQRMKALAVQAQSGSLTDTERGFLNEEFSELKSQITSITSQTKFNGNTLLDGSAGKQITVSTAASTVFGGSSGDRGLSVRLIGDTPSTGTFQLSYAYTGSSSLGQFTLTNGTVSDTVQFTHASGDKVIDANFRFENLGIELTTDNFDFTTAITAGTNSEFTVSGSGTLTFQVGVSSSDTISVDITDVDLAALGLSSASVDTASNATSASTAIDTAIETVNEARANLGAKMSRFEFASANLATSIENLDAARSTLLDVDMAAEMTKFTSAQVMTQASVAMLAQANQLPQNLLRLLA